jgi:hypothetical protein
MSRMATGGLRAIPGSSPCTGKIWMLRNALPCLLLLLLVLAAPVSAQISPRPTFSTGIDAVALPPVAPTQRAVQGLRTHALVRTTAVLAATAAGFHLAKQRQPDRPDELALPIVAGAAAGAVAGLVLSDANPLRVIAGATLSMVPAGALAVYVAETMDDDEQNRYPLLAFAIPQGLLTSGFSQKRSRR